MTLTPPTGLDTEKKPTEEAEDITVQSADEGSDDITVDPTTEAALDTAEAGDGSPVGTPAPEASALAAEAAVHDEPRRTPEPSVSAEAVESSPPTMETTRVTPMPRFPASDDEISGDDIGDASIDEEVTVARSPGDVLARPSITEDEEEETKVETEETAIHAAAIRGDVETGLSEEASRQRDKALRKSSGDIHFADPDSELDDEVVSAGPVLDEDDDGIEVGAHLAPKQRRVEDYSDDDSSMFGHSPGPSALVAALSARRPTTPPTGTPVRTDGFGSARLPTPVPGTVPLPIIGATLPAPASSPFGKIAAGPAPYGSARNTSTSIPALQIPAPSGAAATATDGGGLFRKIPIPVGGLAAAGLSCIVAGVIVGWVARGGTPAPAGPAPVASAPTAPRIAPAPAVPPPVVQPVGAPPPAPPTAVASAAPAVPAAATTPEPAASKPAPAAPEAEATGEPTSRPTPKRVAAKRTKAEEEEAAAPKQVASAKPVASKPTKPAGKTGKKGWVDPFAD